MSKATVHSNICGIEHVIEGKRDGENIIIDIEDVYKRQISSAWWGPPAAENLLCCASLPVWKQPAKGRFYIEETRL